MFDKIVQYLYRCRAERVIKKVCEFLIKEEHRKTNDPNVSELIWHTDKYQYRLVAMLGILNLWGYRNIKGMQLFIMGKDNWHLVVELSEYYRGYHEKDFRYTRLHLGDWAEDFIAYGKESMRQRKHQIDEMFKPLEDEVQTLEK